MTCYLERREGKQREGRAGAVTLRPPRGQVLWTRPQMESWGRGGRGEKGVTPVWQYLQVPSQLAHVELLQPAACVVRVSVRWSVQVGADVLTRPRSQQLLAPRMVPHEAGEVVEAGPAADPAGTGRQAPLDLGG